MPHLRDDRIHFPPEGQLKEGRKVSGDYEDSIAIVGGGITGLFCAWVLKQQGHNVVLYESSDRLGGRIRTVRLDSSNNSLESEWTPDKLEFYVEFGPMRIELNLQLLVRALLDRLDITKDQSKKSYLVDFPAFSSSDSARAPQYDLPADEQGKSPIELFVLALSRIIGRLCISEDGLADARELEQTRKTIQKQNSLMHEIAIAVATGQPEEPILSKWMKERLTENDYWIIQTRGYIGEAPLYTLGFWNLLSDVLSHNALSKLRDLGSFYHMPPENPNAAEWLVWSLRGFAISDKLQGIFGGMENIVEQMLADVSQLRELQNSGSIKYNHRLQQLKRIGGLWELEFQTTGGASKLANRHKHVVLTLPKSPLEKLIRNSFDDLHSLEPEITKLVDSAFGFPMVKTFAVVDNRWWEEDYRANMFASDIPIRELHYWKGLTRSLADGRKQTSKRGLLMAYTDRPATAFWANYVNPGEQDEEATFKTGGRQHPRLKEKIAHYISQISRTNEKHNSQSQSRDRHDEKSRASDFGMEEISWYGIRDWGRDPYGAANHAWRPERKFWVVMRRLAEVGGTSGLHVCGEAFSDYHGFMEGSMRSAVYTLHRILSRYKPNERLRWLDEVLPELQKDKSGERYFNNLSDWTRRLDAVGAQEEFECVEYPETANLRVHVNEDEGAEVMLLRLKDWQNVEDRLNSVSLSHSYKADLWYQTTRKHRLATAKHDGRSIFTIAEVPIENKNAHDFVLAVREKIDSYFSYWFKKVQFPEPSRGNRPLSSHPDRLPTHTRPTRYDISLSVDDERRSFSAKSRIKIHITRSTREIVLNAVDLRIKEAYLNHRLDGQMLNTAPRIIVCGERLVLRFEEKLEAGDAELFVEYGGDIRSDNSPGLCKASYIDTDGRRQFVIGTRSMPDYSSYARRVFPCWDEPEYTAPFNFTLEIKEEFAAFSNIAELETSIPISEGMKRITFGETSSISAHLIEFAFGTTDDDSVTTMADMRNRLAISEQREQRDRDTNRQERDRLKEPRKSTHCDRETDEEGDINHRVDQGEDDSLKASQNASSSLSRSHSSKARPCEMNESDKEDEFASEPADGGTSGRAHRKPQSKEKIQGKQKTHIKHKAKTKSELAENEENEIAAPLNENSAEQSGNNNDEPDEREDTEENSQSSIMNRCFQGEGIPVICVRNIEGAVSLSQSIFSYSSLPDSLHEPLRIPLSYRYIDAKGKTDETTYIMDERNCTLPLEAGSQLVFLNAHGKGVYKTRYDESFKLDLDNILQDHGEFLRFLTDVWSMVIAGDPSYRLETYMEFLHKFRSQTDKPVWSFIISTMSCLNLIIDNEMRESFAAQVQRLLEDVYDRFVPKNAEREYPIANTAGEDQERERNGIVLEAMAILGNSIEAQTRATKWFDEYRNGMHIDPFLVAPVLNIVAFSQRADDLAAATTTYEYVLGLHYQAKKWSKQDADTLRTSLSYFRHPQLIKRTLDSCLTPEVDTQDAENLIRAIMSTPRGRGHAWDFIMSIWPAAGSAEGDNFTGLTLANLVEAIPNLIVESGGSIDVLTVHADKFEKELKDFFAVHRQELSLPEKTLEDYWQKLAIVHSFKIREYENLRKLFEPRAFSNELVEDAYPI